MLFVLFALDADRYALDADAILEVLPLVQIKRIPQAPAGVAGIAEYRGTPLPVIDLCELALGRVARKRLTTRLLVTKYQDGLGNLHRLGLIAESAGETLRREATAFVPSGITNDSAPYLGPLTRDERGLIQRVDVNRLLSDEIREVLFEKAAAT